MADADCPNCDGRLAFTERNLRVIWGLDLDGNPQDSDIEASEFDDIYCLNCGMAWSWDDDLRLPSTKRLDAEGKRAVEAKPKKGAVNCLPSA
jgi:hypothetical protein